MQQRSLLVLRYGGQILIPNSEITFSSVTWHVSLITAPLTLKVWRTMQLYSWLIKIFLLTSNIRADLHEMLILYLRFCGAILVLNSLSVVLFWIICEENMWLVKLQLSSMITRSYVSTSLILSVLHSFHWTRAREEQRGHASSLNTSP